VKKLVIIAEAGVNHNGNIELAKKLIDSAKKAKADYVKFQTFKSDYLVTEHAKMASYQLQNVKKKISQRELLKKYELDFAKHKLLVKYCKKIKINFLSTPFDLESADMLFKLGLKIIKISSGDINNYPLLTKVGNKAKKIILSTGMATLKDIKDAILILKKSKFNIKNLTLLHCTSNYPAKDNEVNLLAIRTIKNKFGTNIGYSDHTLGSEAAIAAVALGAEIIEKHITLNRKYLGPDHKASMIPSEFYNFTKSLRKTSVLLGNKNKIISKDELNIAKLVKKSIVAKNFIKKGELFSENNLICKRPGTGISPIFWKKIIGKKANKNFQQDELIRL
jgi:N,N'-diacetyllegionaminate synthase